LADTSPEIPAFAESYKIHDTFYFKHMQATEFLGTLSFRNIYLALFSNHHQDYVLGLIRKLTIPNSKAHANEREILKAIENDKILLPSGRQGCDFEQP